MIITIILLTILLSECSYASDLTEKCLQNANAFYWKSSCYVFNPVKMLFLEAASSCHEYGEGHLAFITTPFLADLFESVINSLTTESYVVVGLEQIAASSNTWVWVDCSTGKKWYFPPKSTGVPLWSGSQPGSLATDLTGVFKLAEKGLHNTNGAVNMYPSLCQYHDIFTSYGGVKYDARAPADYVMLETNDISQGKCAYKCTENRPCQSFSYNPTTKHCQINWWAATDLTTEFAQGYILFDKE